MALKDDGVERCLRSYGSEFQMWYQSKRRCETGHESLFVLLDFQHAGVGRRKKEEPRCVRDGV